MIMTIKNAAIFFFGKGLKNMTQYIFKNFRYLQVGLANKRKLAFVDRNNDLFLVSVQRVGGIGREVKIGTGEVELI